MSRASRIIPTLAAVMTAASVSACSSDLTLPSDSGSGSPADRSAVPVLDSLLGLRSSPNQIDPFPGD